MDLNWKYQEAMLLGRDELQLTPQEEARVRLAAEAGSLAGRGLRRRLATLLFGLAARLDSDSPWLAPRVRPRLSTPAAGH